MQVMHNSSTLRAALRGIEDIAFVPTMGNLHDGHIALVRHAKQLGGPVVTSIFVNPLQFGPNEDFERYPRTLPADTERLTQAGCDYLFAPSVAEMYPQPQRFVVQPPLANELCGAFRPGHFAGVCTVVLKLFNMVAPRYALFGKKDYQQWFLLDRMTRQLNLPIEVIGAETERADDGLALSSRNGYLTVEQRAEAIQLYLQLCQMRDALIGGERNFRALELAVSETLVQRGWRVDYFSVRAQTTLLPPTPDDRKLVVLGAAWLGNTRLIDNLEVTLPS
ncbi:MAG: pantoate--beta-alanine ligase [Pseudomonadota bacterium]